VVQCCDSLFWALPGSSEAGRVTATCVSPEVPSNLENYQLIVDCSFNHIFGITSAQEWGNVVGLLPASLPDISRCLLCLLVAEAVNSR